MALQCQAVRPGDGDEAGMGDSEKHVSHADLPSCEEEGSELEAFVTMITSDDFAIGAEVMLHSLRQHSRTRRSQVVMVTSEVSEMKRQALKSVADEVIEVSCWQQRQPVGAYIRTAASAAQLARMFLFYHRTRIYDVLRS